MLGASWESNLSKIVVPALPAIDGIMIDKSNVDQFIAK